MGKSSHITKNSQKSKSTTTCHLTPVVCSIQAQKVDNEEFIIKICTLHNKIEETWKILSENTVHLAVSESWLGEIVPDKSVTISGFQVPFRKDRNERGGGVCLYASNNIPCWRRTDFERLYLELVWIEIFYEKTSFLISRCYRPPASTSAFIICKTSLESTSSNKIVLLGDFNAKRSEWFNGGST